MSAGFIRGIIQFEHAAPSGYRFGSRALGLGLDSAILALKALTTRGPVLVTNPWIGIATKLLGRKDLAVIGLYATPGSRTFKLMRHILKDAPVITTVEIEARAWSAAGGRAAAVLYGNTFHYRRRFDELSGELRIFVGGSSDRDPEILRRLEQEIKSSDRAVALVVVTGDTPSYWAEGKSTIRHSGYVPADYFGTLMGESHVVFLPLKQSGRAAGHMVTVGALEAGVPVSTTPCDGMEGYIDGHAVSVLDPDLPLLPQLEERRLMFADRSEELSNYWRSKFSRQAFVERVGEAIARFDSGEML
jgi:hypothetical protein